VEETDDVRGGTPERPLHAIRVEVSEQDIDVLGHANNVAYLRWVQDVAVAHSDAVGLTFARYRELGGVFVVRRHEIDYLRSALRGEVLEVRTWIPKSMAAKVLRKTEVRRLTGEVIVRAETTWGYIDVRALRPTRIPDLVREALGMPRKPREAADPTPES
jgi:acyl-CoA thioester hydrolase